MILNVAALFTSPASLYRPAGWGSTVRSMTACSRAECIRDQIPRVFQKKADELKQEEGQARYYLQHAMRTSHFIGHVPAILANLRTKTRNDQYLA